MSVDVLDDATVAAAGSSTGVPLAKVTAIAVINDAVFEPPRLL